MDVESGLPGGSADAGTTMDYEDTNSLGLDPAAAAADGLQHKTPSPAQQADEIEAAEAKDITEGEQMYLVSEGWWAQWCAYTRYKQPAAEQPDSAAAADGSSEAASGLGSGSATVTGREVPERIDNSDIVYESRLREGLEEGRDFVIVTSDSWSLLHRWYGGGPTITRTAVMEGLAPNSKRPRVMLYPMRLEVCWGGKPNEVKTIEAEKHETVRNLKERACAAFGVDADKVEIWDYFNHGKYSNLDKDLEKDLDAARILDEQPILLDDKDNPLPESNTTASSPIFASCGRPARAASFAEDQSIQREGGRPGLVGLTNLGNTCFMNSSLQCLMHTVPIMRVFLTGSYEADVNTVNPLGLKGQLAMALGNLMNNVWKAGVGSVSPRAFKSKIAQFAPQFSGYQQHDSQEFLAFLLDGLHEDINRIQQKPYIEEPDSEGVPDEQLAATAWDNYRKRNDSSIVDHFQGLYKSTLVCPQCSYSSVKFDPFMYLSLPLPESRVKQLTAVLVHGDGAAPPREYGLEVPQSGTLKDLYVTLARVAGLPPITAPGQQMVAAKLSTRFSWNLTVLEDPSQRVSEMGRDSGDELLLVYYYRDPEDGPGGRQDENRRVMIMHRNPERGMHCGGHKFSAPLLLWLPPSETYDPALHVRRLGGGGSSSKQLFGPSGGRLLGGGGDTEYAVSQDAPIWRHVERMMQPFRAPPALCQQPVLPAAAAAAEGADGEAAGQQQQAGAAMSTEQQPAASAGPGDVSMAAAPGLPPSPSPDPCCTSQPAGTAAAAPAPPAAAAAAPGLCASGAAAGSSGGAWGSDGGAADQTNNKAASEAGDNNSTWGSHGSEAAHSDMDADLGCDETIDEAVGVGISRAASQQQLAEDPAAAAAAAAGGSGGGGGAAMESDGEMDATAALAADLLGGAEGQAASPAAAAAGAGSSGGGMLGSGGVHVAPLDIWAAQTQAAGAESAAVTTPQQQEQQQQQELPTPMAPYYILKLAQDSGNTNVQSWLANQFHPNHHHFSYILDWHKPAAKSVSHEEYLKTCEACSEQLGQQTQQQVGAAAEQQQQDGVQPAAESPVQQQVQSAQPGQELYTQPAPAAAAAAGQMPIWVPDSADPASSRYDERGHVILGAYVVSAMEHPHLDPSVRPIHAARADPRGKVVSLEDCVEAFLQPEQLSEADEWYCPKCKTHVQADKKLDLWRLPEVLVVHLKRFSYTRWNRDKLDTQVKFPLQGLDLSSYVLGSQGQTDPSQAPLYDCYAVSNHYGGLGGGHYTAFGQMPDDKKWYLFDDSRVEETHPEGVQSRAAYLLFYRRRAAAAADAPDLVHELLEAKQQHMQAKEAAAAAAAQQEAAEREAAAAAAGGPVGMDTDSPDTVGTQSLAIIPAGSPEGGWGSPALGTPAGAAAGEGIGGALLGVGSPAPAVPVQAGAGRTGASRRLNPIEDSSDTSTSHRNTGLEEGDSSDGSSSRPQGRVGTLQRQREAAEAQAAAEAVDSWGALQSGGAQRVSRRSDQEGGDADMADRDA